jgi:hypothetical protein
MVVSLERKSMLFFALIILSLMIAQTSISNTLTNLEIYVVGSPIENSFTGYIKIKYAETLTNYTLVSVYIPFEGQVSVLNITSGNGVLVSDYQLENNTISFLAFNTSEITIYFTVENVLEEAGVGSYVTYIDLTRYNNISLNLTVNLVGVYNVEPPINTKYSNGNTLITITQPGYYPITLYLTPETTTPAQPSGLQGEILVLGGIGAALIVLLVLIYVLRRKK